MQLNLLILLLFFTFPKTLANLLQWVFVANSAAAARGATENIFLHNLSASRQAVALRAQIIA
jgi:hypothetical protein